MRDVPNYVLERTFDTSRELVGRTCTDPQLVTRWLGPNVERVVHRLKARRSVVGRNAPGWQVELSAGRVCRGERARAFDLAAFQLRRRLEYGEGTGRASCC